jgi:hypothetical protein
MVDDIRGYREAVKTTRIDWIGGAKIARRGIPGAWVSAGHAICASSPLCRLLPQAIDQRSHLRRHLHDRSLDHRIDAVFLDRLPLADLRQRQVGTERWPSIEQRDRTKERHQAASVTSPTQNSEEAE